MSMGTTAFAEENPNAYFEQYVNDIQGYVQTATASRASATPTEVVQSFIQEHGQEYDAERLQAATITQTVKLDDENAIILDGMMIYVNGVEEVEATPERIAKGAIDTNAATFSAKSTTSVKSYYHAVYALVLGQELYRITQEAQFTYNGSSVSVNYSDGAYERGFLSIWQVSDFEDSKESTITEGGVSYARVKSSANFHYGLEIQGVGLVIQDNYCWVDVRCSKNGTVKGYMDAGHDL